MMTIYLPCGRSRPPTTRACDRVEAARWVMDTSTSLSWVEVGILTSVEERTQLDIKIDMPTRRGDGPRKNLGECAVLACAVHRQMVAVIDDGDGRSQARQRGVTFVTSMGIIAEAWKTLDDIDSEAAERIYSDLLATDMRLPRTESFVGWAYGVELLP